MKLGTTLMSLWMNFRQVMGATGPPPSTLLNDLVSYWPLNEVSGTRYDVVGDNDLTDNNTVGAVLRGPEGTVAKTVYANSEYLSRTQTLDYSLGVTASIWFYQATGANVQGRFFQHGGAHYYGGTGTFSLTDGNSTPNLYAGVGDNASIVNATAQSSGLNAWHHVVMWYDPSDKKVRMRLDGQTAVASASGLANHPNPAAGLYNDVVIGRETVVGVYTDALFGPTALWNRLLTTDEQTALFAAGNAARYADVDVGASCIGWWELDEVSGVRYDSHGTNDLTDNNTVDCEYQGPLGVVASTVEANSEYLSSTSADFTPAGSFSASLWVYITSSDICFFMGKEFTDPQSEWSLLTGAAGELEGRFWGGGLTQAGPPVAGWASRPNNWSASNLNRWWLLTYVYDATAHTVTMYLNDAAGAPASTGVRTLSELGGAFTLLGGARSAYDTNKAASAGFWTKALSGAEVTELFNNGAGLRYANLSDGLKTNLVSWWNLDEASGVRYDSHGSNDLTDNNTVGSVINAGGAMDGAAASFVAANSEKLTRADTTGTFGDGVSQTFSFWFKDTTAGTTGGAIIARDNATTREWAITAGNTTITVLGFDSGGNPVSQDSFAVFGDTFAKNQWHHAIVWYDFSDSKFHYQADGGVVRDFPTTLDYVRAGTGPLEIGASTYYAQADLMIDEVAIWSRVLTEDERAELYALGAGKFYPFTE